MLNLKKNIALLKIFKFIVIENGEERQQMQISFVKDLLDLELRSMIEFGFQKGIIIVD